MDNLHVGVGFRKIYVFSFANAFRQASGVAFTAGHGLEQHGTFKQIK